WTRAHQVNARPASARATPAQPSAAFAGNKGCESGPMTLKTIRTAPARIRTLWTMRSRGACVTVAALLQRAAMIQLRSQTSQIPRGTATGRATSRIEARRLPCALEVALEHADVDERGVGRIRPEVFAPETHVVGGLVLGGHAVRVGVGEGVGGGLAHDHAGLAADIGRHAHVSRHEVLLDAHAFPGLEALASRSVAASRRARRRKRECAARASLELLA